MLAATTRQQHSSFSFVINHEQSILPGHRLDSPAPHFDSARRYDPSFVVRGFMTGARLVSLLPALPQYHLFIVRSTYTLGISHDFGSTISYFLWLRKSATERFLDATALDAACTPLPGTSIHQLWILCYSRATAYRYFFKNLSCAPTFSSNPSK